MYHVLIIFSPLLQLLPTLPFLPIFMNFFSLKIKAVTKKRGKDMKSTFCSSTSPRWSLR